MKTRPIHDHNSENLVKGNIPILAILLLITCILKIYIYTKWGRPGETQRCSLLCTSQFQNHPSPPQAIPGHLTRVKFRTVGNLTQNEARPVGHLTFMSKRLSAVGSKRISQFFDSAGEPRSPVIALVDSTWVFLLL